ncbi:MAG TPA: ATP-binding protein [Planctomycetota bacterium]|nr:ATP-binding protein [Planctomycetota bacterium]
MFLIERLEFLSLIGLFVQAFLAWVFVAILATMRRGERASGAFDHFFFAFAALASALTVLAVRFFHSHQLDAADSFWLDGHWAPTACYVAYQGLKGLFGLFLVRGSFALADKAPPRWLYALIWAMVAMLAVSPLLLPEITALLVVQAPVMVACSFVALSALAGVPVEGSGPRVVRGSLIGLACAWILDGAAAGLHEQIPSLRYVLATNSYFDLGVQLALGTGLVVSLLQDTHRRLRAAELERERLQRELDRDEKLRALGTMLSGVAHELNNPLTVILGYADLIASTEADNEAARIVAEQAQRCRGIVRNLSALAGQSQHPLQEMKAAELVDRVVRGINLDREAAQRLRVARIDELRFHADRVGMEQVLANLISNALAASSPQGLVWIEAAPCAAGITFSVRDEGPGVPPELRARLFEPFFTTKGPGKGMGLGLSIAHAIVRAHGGTISVEDGPDGRGALFRVVIPHAAAQKQRESKVLVTAGPTRRLLIIDDEAAVRSVVRRQAERRGWRVSEADSAESAFSGSNRIAEFDAVLCDLRMPGMGGAGLHDRFQSEFPAALERTVFVTGDLASPESVLFSRRCARPLVQKPFEFDELFAIVDRKPGYARI